MDNKVSSLIGTSMEKIKNIVDANTVVGQPITTPSGTVLLPVSKISVGFGSGGSDIPSAKEKELFGGGAGGGVTVTPLAFIAISPEGDAKLLQLSPEPGSVDRLVDLVPDLVGKVSTIFTPKSKAPAEKPAEQPAEKSQE